MSMLFGRSQYDPVINVMGGIRVNTSLQGQPIPIVYGRNRIAPNLIWYNDFFWEQVSGGKKGNTRGGGTGKKAGGEYDYGAAVILGLCQGPINGIGTVWNTAGNLPAQSTTESFTVPGGGGSYTATNAATYLRDLGVNRGDGFSVVVNDYGAPGPITLVGTQQTPMTYVAGGGTPGTGQYTRSGTNSATYNFAAGDVGKTMTIAYAYAPPLTTGGLPQDPISTVGFTLFNGTQEQAPWSYLTSKHPSQAIGYSTLAYLATPVLDLGMSAVTPNFNFEVFGLLPFGATGGNSGTFVEDTFTGPGSTLSSNWTVNSGTWKVFPPPAFPPYTMTGATEGETPLSAGNGAAAYWNKNPFPADQYASVDVSYGGSVHLFDRVTGWTGPAVRVSASSETYYTFLVGGFTVQIPSPRATWRLDKVVSGVRTNLANGNIPTAYGAGLNPGISLSVQGTTLIARINGVIISTVMDSSIASGQPGIAAYLPPTPGVFGLDAIVKWVATQTPYGTDPTTGPLGDANPADVFGDIFTNPLYGCGIQNDELGNFTQYSNYCIANGLFMSPILDSERTAADWIRDFLDATNSELVESGGTLNVIPYGDSSQVGNGVQYTPATNPIYNLTADSFIRSGTEPAIEITRPSVQDAYNSVRIEYYDRGNSYNPAVIEAQDLVSLQSYKYRPEPMRQYHFFTSQPPASLSAQLGLARNVYIRLKYKFKLPQSYILLDPMDLVTIPAQLLGMAASLPAVPVRITSISEQDDRTLEVEAEQFPWGTAGNTLYPKQALTPGGPQVMAPPGSVNTPIIFEALSRLNNQIGHTIWFGLSGANANWGGCRIWLSMDGTNYKQIATAIGQTQMGVLTANLASHADPDTVDTLSVDLTESFGSLISYTSAETDVFASLCYIAGANPELIAYQNATLTSAFHYNLATKLRRGVYGSVIGAHLTNDPFMFLNDAVEGYSYDVGLIGTTVSFKFTSFNQSGLVEELLANVTAYPYTVTGAAIGQLTPAHASYRPTSNPLTAHDAGASATINVASFSMRIPGQADIPFGSGAITGLSYNTLYYVYVNDPGYLAQPSPTYLATTTKETALVGAGNMFVGSILTPLAGAPDTVGNNDGGGGAQIGSITIIGMTYFPNSTQGNSGNGATTNPQNAGDGNKTTFATISASSTGGGSAFMPMIAGAGHLQNFSKIELHVLWSVPTNTLAGTVNPALTMTYSEFALITQPTIIFPTTFFGPSVAPGTTEPLTETVFVLPPNVNIQQFYAALNVTALSGAGLSGSVTANIYEMWLQCYN